MVSIANMVRLRPITADEYHRMGKSGILAPGERVELLNGRIVQVPPIGPRHNYTVAKLDDVLRRVLGDRAVVIARGPIRLDRLSEPQPDLVVLRGPLERYAERHPEADDAILVIEVADSSLRTDRGEKLRAYARLSVREYWVVDVRRRRLFVYSQPEGEGYRTRDVLEGSAVVAPGMFPSCTIVVDDVLPPRSRSNG